MFYKIEKIINAIYRYFGLRISATSRGVVEQIENYNNPHNVLKVAK